MRQCEIKITAAFIRSAFDDLRHLRHKDDRVEMSHNVADVFLHAIQQDFLAQALSVHAGGLEDEPYFKTVLGLAALIVRHETGHRQRILRFVKVHDLPVSVGLERCECRQKINGFKDGSFSLRVLPYQHNSPPWKLGIQAGETAKVGEG